MRAHLLLPLLASYSAAVHITVAKSEGNATSGLPYGAMEKNYCGEGGLYAELIRNRAFQGSIKYPSSLDAWSAIGESDLSLQNLSNLLSSVLPASVKVKGKGTAGIDVRPQKYYGSFYVKGSYSGVFPASLQSSTGKTLASVNVSSKSVADDWAQHEFSLTPKKSAANIKNTFSLTFDTSAESERWLFGLQPDQSLPATPLPWFLVPFLMNVNKYQWSPRMIAFNSNPDETASYLGARLFNHNLMTHMSPTTSTDSFGPLYYATGVNSKTESRIFKTTVYNSTADVPVSLTFEGVGRGATADLTILTAPDANEMNQVGGPNIVKRPENDDQGGARRACLVFNYQT
ncbi:hypothetical protein N7492_001536 [Penicillium capsulatum]|uniref:Uncharacterized protein n=1 Tax=Penicillium capsulatum TaxID=69766 RepID=A0A9W9ISJ0_9EURO|nr:hypothetical protein N7492_001536 [Penicillium capsulatum]KAJ6129411.1 hypothetical protein N7512_002191 [Penicillium capsulatum]